MRMFLAPLAGASLIVTAPAAASAQPTATTPPPAPPFVVSIVAPRVPGRPPVPGKVISLAPTTTPVDPTALALAHQILTIAFPPEKRSEVFASRMDAVVEMVRKNIEGLGDGKDKEFQALVAHSTQRMFEQMKVTIGAALPDIFESMARAYARDFSTDDLSAILAFVKHRPGSIISNVLRKSSKTQMCRPPNSG